MISTWMVLVKTRIQDWVCSGLDHARRLARLSTPRVRVTQPSCDLCDRLAAIRPADDAFWTWHELCGRGSLVDLPPYYPLNDHGLDVELLRAIHQATCGPWRRGSLVDPHDHLLRSCAYGDWSLAASLIEPRSDLSRLIMTRQARQREDWTWQAMA